MHAFVMISFHVLVGMNSVTISQLNVKDLAINVFLSYFPPLMTHHSLRHHHCH